MQATAARWPSRTCPWLPWSNDPGDYDAGPDEAFFNCALRCREAWAPMPCSPTACGAYPAFSRGVAFHLNDEQEALIGCGRFYGTDCDVDGFDFFVGEGSALFQSWPGFEGTEGGIWLTGGPVDPDNSDDPPPPIPMPWQPGTRAWQPGTDGFVGGPVCTRYGGGRDLRAPGLQRRDSSSPAATPSRTYPGCRATPQPWNSELAALSWNMLIAFVTLSDGAGRRTTTASCSTAACAGSTRTCTPLNGLNDEWEDKGLDGRYDQFNPLDPYNPDRCSYTNPTVCYEREDHDRCHGGGEEHGAGRRGEELGAGRRKPTLRAARLPLARRRADRARLQPEPHPGLRHGLHPRSLGLELEHRGHLVPSGAPGGPRLLRHEQQSGSREPHNRPGPAHLHPLPEQEPAPSSSTPSSSCNTSWATRRASAPTAPSTRA